MEKPLYIKTTHWNPSLHYSSLNTEVEVSSDSLAPTYLHRRPKTVRTSQNQDMARRKMGGRAQDSSKVIGTCEREIIIEMQ